MLDRFYVTEEPLTDSVAYRICRPRTVEEETTLSRLLEEFFTKTPSGYINNRAVREIEAMHEKSEKARKSADSRWMRTHSECNADAMLSENQDPRTKNKKSALAGYLPSTKAERQHDGAARKNLQEWINAVG